MRIAAALGALLLASCRATAPAPSVPSLPPVQPDGSIAFMNVGVIPMTPDIGVLRNQTVIVRDGRIAEIGPAATVAVSPGAERIDGRGRYLLPGLADMHVHLEYFETPEMLKLFTAGGVTFVRSMDGRPRILEWKKAIAAGSLEGPAIQTAGPLLDGAPPVLPDNTVVRTPEEARAAVAEQHEAGYDFIKVYTNLSVRAYEAILEEAKQRGMPVAGHVPRHSTMAKALEGHASIEHLAAFDELIEAESSPFYGRFHWSKLYLAMEADPQKIAEAGRRVARSGVAVVPTLVEAMHAVARPAVLASWMRRDELQLVPAEVREFWETRVRGVSDRLDEEDWPVIERGRQNRRDLVAALDAAGAKILAGTDTPNPFVVPGVSLHRELELLVAAGLTPKEALAAATREAAAFAGEADEWGTIEEGKRADLLLLHRNPLEDIAATRNLDRVMVRGKLAGRAGGSR
ncbi:MAG TPA: amidohydrolase family protein [Thermoanaerobaculia bacterium]|nr:amidohydrolase family protein [Thermoanaerobaculia bacterium]